MQLQHLHASFLDPPAAYRAAELYWQTLWGESVAHSGVQLDWKVGWVSTGSPELRDGNPIFSAVSRRLLRGFRAIQHPPTSSVEAELAFWTDTLELDPTFGLVTELVISCAPCVEIERELRELMLRWGRGDVLVQRVYAPDSPGLDAGHPAPGGPVVGAIEAGIARHDLGSLPRTSIGLELGEAILGPV